MVPLEALDGDLLDIHGGGVSECLEEMPPRGELRCE